MFKSLQAVAAFFTLYESEEFRKTLNRIIDAVEYVWEYLVIWLDLVFFYLLDLLRYFLG